MEQLMYRFHLKTPIDSFHKYGLRKTGNGSFKKREHVFRRFPQKGCGTVISSFLYFMKNKLNIVPQNQRTVEGCGQG